MQNTNIIPHKKVAHDIARAVMAGKELAIVAKANSLSDEELGNIVDLLRDEIERLIATAELSGDDLEHKSIALQQKAVERLSALLDGGDLSPQMILRLLEVTDKTSGLEAKRKATDTATGSGLKIIFNMPTMGDTPAHIVTLGTGKASAAIGETYDHE